MEENGLWEQYWKGKQANHRYNKDNTPFTKREKRLMREAFRSGYNWQDCYERKKREI